MFYWPVQTADWVSASSVEDEDDGEKRSLSLALLPACVHILSLRLQLSSQPDCRFDGARSSSRSSTTPLLTDRLSYRWPIYLPIYPQDRLLVVAFRASVLSLSFLFTLVCDHWSTSGATKTATATPQLGNNKQWLVSSSQQHQSVRQFTCSLIGSSISGSTNVLSVRCVQSLIERAQ